MGEFCIWLDTRITLQFALREGQWASCTGTFAYHSSACVMTVSLIGLSCQLRMVDEYGAFGGMEIGRGNRSAWGKLASMPLCPPHIPHNLTWDRTQAAAVGSRRLTAWAIGTVCCLSKLSRYTTYVLLKRKPWQLVLILIWFEIRFLVLWRNLTTLIGKWRTCIWCMAVLMEILGKHVYSTQNIIHNAMHTAVLS
jgi:hypothetical protein